MSEAVREAPKKERPEFRNIHVHELSNYRLPLAGVVSILHRISGFLMFALLPFVLYLLATEHSLRNLLRALPWLRLALVKLIILALSWAYLQHFCAGVRHLFMDTHIGLDKDSARKTRGHRAGHQPVPDRAGRPETVRSVLKWLTTISAQAPGRRRPLRRRDWLAQRVTAVLMVLYTAVLLVSFLTGSNFSYEGWAGLFAQQWFKLFSLVTLFGLFYHAWVGMRDIWMDYVKPVGIL
jgi:succinate dehydrogenase / fumarate reductase cytochrome b subunit